MSSPLRLGHRDSARQVSHCFVAAVATKPPNFRRSQQRTWPLALGKSSCFTRQTLRCCVLCNGIQIQTQPETLHTEQARPSTLKPQTMHTAFPPKAASFGCTAATEARQEFSGFGQASLKFFARAGGSTQTRILIFSGFQSSGGALIQTKILKGRAGPAMPKARKGPRLLPAAAHTKPEHT